MTLKDRGNNLWPVRERLLQRTEREAGRDERRNATDRARMERAPPAASEDAEDRTGTP